MGKKDEFSWIIYILLMEYALSEDTCERGTCLGHLSFGEFLPRSAFTTKYEVSPYQCATECWLRRQRCKSFNYRRSALSCQLCEEDSGPEGVNLQPKAGSIHSNINTWKNIPIGHCKEINCSWTQRCDPSRPLGASACVHTECAFSELKLGMTIEPSNETAVGTKARRRCMSQNMERGDPITTCLDIEAEWSNPDFKCVCKSPPAKSGTIYETTDVDLGHNYTYRCQEGLFEKSDQNPTVACLPDGIWTSTNFTCVCKNPPAKSWTINETVEVEIGQNYTYRCQGGLFGKRDQNSRITCLHDGNWTSTNFTCVCKTPLAKSGMINETIEVEVGQNYTYRCQDGLFGKGDQNPTITCLEDGSWTSTSFICVKQNWMRDIIYPNNIHTSNVISKVTGIDLLACMQQCDDNPNNCLSFFYDNHSSHCVLSSSFRRGLPQGLQVSDGLVYYTAPSALCDIGYSNVSLGRSYFCIKFHDLRQTFDKAMETCESEKAKLLVVTSQNQITDLYQFVLSKQDTVRTFVGISYNATKRAWVSWKGEVVYPYWSPGEPDMINKVVDCAFIRPDIPNAFGLWDNECSFLISFVCHKSHL